jgi:hypothetical protein
VVPSTPASFQFSDTSEIASFRQRNFELLMGVCIVMWWYHRLPHLVNTVMPVREHRFDGGIPSYLLGGRIVMWWYHRLPHAANTVLPERGDR